MDSMHFACVLHDKRVKYGERSPETGWEIVHEDDSPCESLTFIAHFDTRVPRDMAYVSLKLISGSYQKVLEDDPQ